MGEEECGERVIRFPAKELCFDGPNGALIDGILDACSTLVGAGNDSGLTIVGHFEDVGTCLQAQSAADAEIFIYACHNRFPPSIPSKSA